MAIKSFFYLDGNVYNVLKFDYKLLYETTKEIQKKKERDVYENAKYLMNFDTEEKIYAKAVEEYEDEQLSKGILDLTYGTYKEYMDNKLTEKSNEDQYYPQGCLKGGFINFHILAQPTDKTKFHKWLINQEEKDRKDGSFCFTLSVNSKKEQKFISFSKAHCVSLQETFATQSKDQMLLKIKILPMCIYFGNNSQYFHQKITVDEEKLDLIDLAQMNEEQARSYWERVLQGEGVEH